MSVGLRCSSVTRGQSVYMRWNPGVSMHVEQPYAAVWLEEALLNSLEKPGLESVPLYNRYLHSSRRGFVVNMTRGGCGLGRWSYI